MTDREIMQQALDALDYEAERGYDDGYRQLRDALRDRLAQPEQEPAQQPVQEPVYWEVRCTAHPKWMRVDEQQFDEYLAHGWEGQRLYTSPSQRKPEQEPVELCERICAAIKSADDKSVSEADYMLDSDDCIEIVRAHFVVGEPTQPQRKPDQIVDVTKMVPFQDLAAELFVVAQRSPADDGFSDTMNRIEAWLRNHFSTPPQRKPLTDEDTVALIKQCRDAFAEELGAWDIDPPIHHVQQGYDNCVNWLAAHGITGEQHG